MVSDARVGATYEVHTADAVVQVHGTVFETAVENGQASVATSEGNVDLLLGADRVPVPAGEVIRTAGGRVAERAALSGVGSLTVNAQLVGNRAPVVAQVLRAVLSAVPVDFVNTMGIPADDAYAKFGEPPAWAEFRAIAKEAGVAATIEPISKWDFYKHVESPDHVLTIQTGDQALWANVLLTLGCQTN